MFFLACQDDTPGKTVEEKIWGGATAYQQLFHAPANVCVCSAANVAAVNGRVGLIDVGVAIDNKPAWIATPNLFLLGRIETAKALGDYRASRGALQSGDDTPSEVLIRRMRGEG